jgi:hypothetical protein
VLVLISGLAACSSNSAANTTEGGLGGAATAQLLGVLQRYRSVARRLQR